MKRPSIAVCTAGLLCVCLFVALALTLPWRERTRFYLNSVYADDDSFQMLGPVPTGDPTPMMYPSSVPNGGIIVDFGDAATYYVHTRDGSHTCAIDPEGD